jgi:uncharacterized protein
VESPCNRRCTLDDDDVCMGCARTLDEIVGWWGMTDDQRRAVLERLVTRPRRP